ncbi:hypothetical protein EMPS_09480 [Entomortierella parvispora]|uniref:Uncharacterized protein n=1 Tax=Entomortierella parvispora TaxID=205924 RepID=A0A9P3HI89_9FUNG|nr:hypothetical protein EMPS_09480 [Entomortierella parvispora]
MIRQHQQTLTCLTVKCPYSLSTNDRPIFSSLLWKQLLALTALKELSVNVTRVGLDDWALVWRILSSRLIRLTLSCVHFFHQRDKASTGANPSNFEVLDQEDVALSSLSLGPPSSDATTESSFQQATVIPTIKELKVDQITGRSAHQMLEWIQSCLQLRSLTWIPGYDQTHWEPLFSPLAILMSDIERLPELTFLEVEDDDHRPNEMLTFLMTRTPGFRLKTTATTTATTTTASAATESGSPLPASDSFRGLDLMSDSFDGPCWRWMASHLDYFKTATVMYFVNCLLVSGAMIQEMLCSLPNLITFSADMLSNTDVEADPRPWVCLKLEHFRVNCALSGPAASNTLTTSSTPWIQEGPTADQIQTMILFFQRISTLKYLETLDLPNYYPDHQTALDLDFRLGRGLELLADLQGMKTLIFRFLKSNLEEAEMEWMAKHWPRLKTLDGRVHMINDKDKKIQEHFWRCKRKAFPNASQSYILI